MPSLKQYVQELIRQRNDLADNLVEQDVDASHTEKYNALVPKVLDISGGNGKYEVPIEYDWNIGYVDNGTWKYENPTRTYIDIYEVEANRRYFIFVGAVPGSRFRVMFTTTDIRGKTTNVSGTSIINTNNPVAYRSTMFMAPEDGYVLFAKDNVGVSGLISYVVDYTDGEAGGGGSGEISITENGKYNVRPFAKALVDVYTEPTLIEKIINENGEYTAADELADGFSKVIVNVPLPIVEPYDYDFTAGYINSGTWYPQPGSHNDQYQLKEGQHYVIMLGEMVGNRFRIAYFRDDVKTYTKTTSGIAVCSDNNSPSSFALAPVVFCPSYDGYLVIQKSNRGDAGVKSYVFEIDEML